MLKKFILSCNYINDVNKLLQDLQIIFIIYKNLVEFIIYKKLKFFILLYIIDNQQYDRK